MLIGEGVQTGEKIRVILVDTHTLMREALRRVLSTFPQTQVCACLSSLENVKRVVQKTQAHVAILSSSIPVSACLDLVKVISESQVPIGIVVIRHCLNPETTMTFIKHGVQSLLGEESSEEDLAKAITTAAAGNTFLDRRAREILDGSVFRTPAHFTRREIEVLSVLKCGESNYRIASALGVSEKAVEKHLTHIYEKLHVNSRFEAILQIQHLQL
jgi:DNA-binding NarL/FixJ family response regulator